ncbi:hypothetical protein D2E92_02035 [Mycobacteroides abscessus]|uniref:hypothetical protein n=1 Tax=Mycobacteroides abscessus TaxID=36809 RepID=UPI000D3EAD73|nr:hypothetical protein [Mycobacteroides abscessus]PVB27854.1 hypothetical protein DDJ92_21450 [Mycobacteroides abscessus]RIU39969.1 hypothetical protein D2E92_02035 [Mycobacteroides abscessus]
MRPADGYSAVNVPEVVGLIAGSSLLSSLGVALLSRKSNTFSKFTEAYEALADRVTKLEEKLETVEGALEVERDQHSKARDLLRIALRYIRDVLSWGVGDRQHPLPEPPPELFRHLELPEN